MNINNGNNRPRPAMNAGSGPKRNMDAQNILDNFITSTEKRPNKHHKIILKTVALYIAGKFLHKQIKNYVKVNNSTPSGFNYYWGLILGELLTSISYDQKNLIVKKFGTGMISHINESELISFEESNDSYEAEQKELVELMTNNSNMIELSNNARVGVLNIILPQVEKFPISLWFHARTTNNVSDFLESVFAYTNLTEPTQNDIDKLTIHYERYYQ